MAVEEAVEEADEYKEASEDDDLFWIDESLTIISNISEISFWHKILSSIGCYDIFIHRRIVSYTDTFLEFNL